jgi:hypothetical protein
LDAPRPAGLASQRRAGGLSMHGKKASVRALEYTVPA